MHFTNISQQFSSMLHGIIVGAVFALVYDCIRIVRLLIFNVGGLPRTFLWRLPTANLAPFRSIRRFSNAAAVNIFDLAYGIFITVFTCIFIYWENSGIVRFYLIFSLALGFALYRLSLGILVMKAAEYIAGLFRRLAGFVLWLAFLPFKWLWRLLKLIFTPFFGVVIKKFKILKTERIKRGLAKAVRFSLQ